MSQTLGMLVLCKLHTNTFSIFPRMNDATNVVHMEYSRRPFLILTRYKIWKLFPHFIVY